MDEIIRRSERLVVMSAHGATLLHEVYGVDAAKVDMIPHGIPEVMFGEGDKDRLGVAGKQVILTFGLLSPDKGIEYVIDAMPAILERHPDTVYIVLGATHPHVLAHAGESYRLMLEARAQALGVDGSMIFHNRFVSQAELGEFLTAADLYVTPYLNAEQSTSGTLAYAVGAGKAVISTPYQYATELLADGRGVIVPVRDAGAIAREVIELLDDGVRMATVRQCAASYGREMSWPAVARLHVASLEHAASSHAHRRRNVFRARTLAERPASLPELSLDHLQCITDDTGVLQHASSGKAQQIRTSHRLKLNQYRGGLETEPGRRHAVFCERSQEPFICGRRGRPSLARKIGDRQLSGVGQPMIRGCIDDKLVLKKFLDNVFVREPGDAAEDQVQVSLA